MRLDLSCPALRASLHTTDPVDAARWLVSVLTTCPVNATVAVCINGVDRGARIAARLMSLSEVSVTRSIEAEFSTLRKVA